MARPPANRRGAMMTGLVAIASLCAATARGAASFPPGFAEALVLNGLHRPTSLDFGPGGELWISGQASEVWIYRGGSPILAAKLPVDTQGERGIGGIALDPDYATNHYVWLDYTLATPPIHNRLSRYLAFNEGEIRKIVYVGGDNRQPIANGTVSPDAGPGPLGVTFDASASRDPEGEALSYRWTFGDGQVSTEPVVAHTYAPGAHAAKLTVADNDGGSDTTPPFRIVSGNRRPEVQITSPPEGSGYQAGQQFVFIGTAQDPEDGPLSCVQFHWAVVPPHLQHTHPFLGPLQGVCQGEFSVPPNISGHSVMDKDISFEVRLSVDDAGTPLGPAGILAGTASVVIKPEKERKRLPHLP